MSSSGGSSAEEKKDDAPSEDSSALLTLKTHVALLENPAEVQMQQHEEISNPNPSVVKDADSTPSTNTASATATSTGTTKKRRRRPKRSFFDWFGLVGSHLIITIAFFALAAAYVLQLVHDDYFVPIVQRARRTDFDLLEEFTYYERQCNVADLTAITPEEATDLYIQPGDTGVDQIMKHGTVILPNLLSVDTIRDLRQFVVEKNAAVLGTDAEYPISQGNHRISYGIEATEDERVIHALKEIHDHRALEKLLEGLVGKNPALTEITAMTASFGCADQNWHPDVKPDGNAVQFGRTYSHSYSLFIPLQDTTYDMGATDLCPGTHYCTDELHEICDENRIRLNQVGEDDVWKAGDAALFNQQVWHRGTAHRDPNALERIVFIVSFLGRPNDPRQLSRGTYFHMKWNMWGHTWEDLADSAVSMARPWCILRCLHLWKPKDREWGYDLFTSAALRIANNQLGCEPEELPIFVNALASLGLPEFLDGTIDPDHEQAWQIYIGETIANVLHFLTKVNVFILAFYFGTVVLVAILMHFLDRSGLRFLWRGTSRVMWTHGSVAMFMFYILSSIRSSPWAIKITSGETLMRPFPTVDSVWKDYDPAVSIGRDALPSRYDVLVGTRLNVRTIGAYSRWLDFHPGNLDFLDYVLDFGGALYRSYERGLPPAFKERLIDGAIENIGDSEGRFLQQDYRTAGWISMTPMETRAFVRLCLVVGTESLPAALKQEIDFLIGDYRFGMHRATSLSLISQSYMRKIEKELFGELDPLKMEKSSTAQVPKPKSFLSGLPLPITDKEEGRAKRWTAFPKISSRIRLFQEVAVWSQEGEYLPATVIDMDEDGRCDIAFYGEASFHYGTFREDVSCDHLIPAMPAGEGARVIANYGGKGSWFPGQITSIWPNRFADILYDDGDFEEGVPANIYRLVNPEFELKE